MSNIEAYIRQAAARRGIDPDIAVRVARSEGGLSNPVQQSLAKRNGVREPSFGPYQLLIGGGNTGFPAGMGNDALKAGIDPRDPNQWQRGVDFALDRASKNGWGSWYGAKAAGINNMDGIGGAKGVTLNSVPASSGYVDPYVKVVPPSSPAPQVASAPVSPTPQSAAPNNGFPLAPQPPSVFDSFKDGGMKAGLNAMSGNQSMMNGLGAIVGLMRGRGGGGDDGSARIDPAQGIASSDQADASRVQASQQLMSTLLGTDKLRNPVRGLSLMGYV